MKKTISGIIFVLLIIGFIYLGTRNYKTEDQTDNQIFSAEYEEIDENNIYVYLDASRVLQKLRSDSGIFFFGFKQNIWAGYYANILNSAAMDLGVEEIYYYDFYEDRKNHNGSYESIVELLGEHIITLDDGTKNLYSPSMVIVKEGKIVAFNSDTAFMNSGTTPDKYWTDYQKNLEKIKLTNLIQGYLLDAESDASE